MDSLYNTYLKMLTTPFDDPSSDLPDISPEDYECGSYGKLLIFER